MPLPQGEPPPGQTCPLRAGIPPVPSISPDFDVAQQDGIERLFQVTALRHNPIIYHFPDFHTTGLPPLSTGGSATGGSASKSLRIPHATHSIQSMSPSSTRTILSRAPHSGQVAPAINRRLITPQSHYAATTAPHSAHAHETQQTAPSAHGCRLATEYDAETPARSLH